MASEGTRKGIKASEIKSITAESGYVTASICWQPIQPGLKKSSRTGLPSFFAMSSVWFMSVSQGIVFFIISPPFG